MLKLYGAAAILLAGTGIAAAQEPRPLCADRPGLGTPACTVDPGRTVVELGGIDWALDQDATQRSDTLIAGDLLIRHGVTSNLEIQAGWTAFGTVRTRYKVTGTVARSSGAGDVTLAARYNLSNPDGSGFSAAIMPYATLPTGGEAIGAGDWGAGLILPISYSLNDTVGIALTPAIDAAVDSDRDGRHFAYGSVFGISAALSDAVSGALEVQLTRDEDPAGHTTEALASLSFAWVSKDRLQIDAGAVAGLNADSPDLQLYFGITRRF
jgi:Putative MetA-pathway of phenol degradation